MIALTHVCRTWRETFISRSSLWTDIGGVDPDKAKVYLERSNPSPVNLSLRRSKDPLLDELFFQIIPQAIQRLKSLTISGTPQYLQDIAAHLYHPAPLLEYLLVLGRYELRGLQNDPVLTPAHFGGDLSSLRRLCLECIHTGLPWRNMANLTSFRLVRPSPISFGQILDFFESAPHLREVELRFVTLTPGAKDGRLVPLACLKKMDITGGGSASPLLEHMLIPIGACLTAWISLPNPPIEDPPRFLDNLKNLPHFTTIQLDGDDSYPHMNFCGPNGEVTLIITTSITNETCFVLESLTKFDTSRTELLTIDLNDTPSSDPLYRTLLPMKDLRTLRLSFCEAPHVLIHVLHPGMNPSGVVFCPKLEELHIEYWKIPDMGEIIGMAAERKSRGARLKLVRIVSQVKSVEADMLELKKHVLHVECGPEAGTDGGGDGSHERG